MIPEENQVPKENQVPEENQVSSEDCMEECINDEGSETLRSEAENASLHPEEKSADKSEKNKKQQVSTQKQLGCIQ